MAQSFPSIFNPDEAFFVIDSDHLEETRTAFYGFTFLNDAVVDCLEALNGQNPEEDGAYVYLKREGARLTITQDFIGSWGLYLYRQEDYFALSNSFLYLVEYLRDKRPLSLNKEFADYMLVADLCSAVFEETLVREITLLDRGAVVEINIPDRTLNVRLVDYMENTVDPSTPEGLAILDGWRDKWVGRIRHIAATSGNIRTDLSGGFDSRETLSLFLASGIDLNEIQVFSNMDGLHTHAEDYEIASRIAEHYGFPLNKNKVHGLRAKPCSLEDIVNISFYVKLGFHKQMYYAHEMRIDRKYTFTGNAGGCIRDLRGLWGATPADCIKKAGKLPPAFAKMPKKQYIALQRSAKGIVERSFQTFRQKYYDLGRPMPEDELTQNLYRETRCRHHFGKSIVVQYLVNGYTISPLLDPDLYKLKLTTEDCPDFNLLSALILERYLPGSIDFGFDRGRTVDPKTMDYVRMLNQKYPCPAPPPLPADFVWPDRPTEPAPPRPALPKGAPDKMLRAAFRSSGFRAVFDSVYDDAVYQAVATDLATRSYFPLSVVNVAVAIVKIQKDIQVYPYLHSGFPDYLTAQAKQGKAEQAREEKEKVAEEKKTEPSGASEPVKAAGEIKNTEPKPSEAPQKAPSVPKPSEESRKASPLLESAEKEEEEEAHGLLKVYRALRKIVR